MDYEQDYTRLNRNQILWYGNDETSAATGDNASGQQQGSAEINGTRDMILDDEDFNWQTTDVWKSRQWRLIWRQMRIFWHNQKKSDKKFGSGCYYYIPLQQP